MTVLTTARLRLEPLDDSHLDALGALNSDPEVMRYIASGRPETIDETRSMIARVKQRWATTGFSWWGLIERDTGELVGAAALQHLRRDPRTEPDPTCPLELGWRLRPDRWGRGLASEAARAIGDFAFDRLHPPELLAVCDPDNTASANVMRRIGMRERGLERWYGKDLLTFETVPDRWRARSTAPAGGPAGAAPAP